MPHYFDPYNITYKSRSLATTQDANAIFDDFRSEIAFLKSDPRVLAPKVGAVGFSMGGYWALVLAAKGEIQAGVSYYGALTGGGKSLNLRFPLREIFTKESSPVLILHGTDDETVPVDHAKSLAAVLDQEEAPYEIHIYEGATHRFERETSSEKNSQAATDA